MNTAILAFLVLSIPYGIACAAFGWCMCLAAKHGDEIMTTRERQGREQRFEEEQHANSTINVCMGCKREMVLFTTRQAKP